MPKEGGKREGQGSCMPWPFLQLVTSNITRQRILRSRIDFCNIRNSECQIKSLAAYSVPDLNLISAIETITTKMALTVTNKKSIIQVIEFNFLVTNKVYYCCKKEYIRAYTHLKFAVDSRDTIHWQAWA